MAMGVHKIARVRSDLPAWLTNEAGRIVIRWAHLEYELQTTIWQLLGVNNAQGRIAIREPRCSDRAIMIRDLLETRGFKMDQKMLNPFVKRLNEVQALRDLIAHGIWVKDRGKWTVVLSRGSYPQELMAHSKNRRIAPEGLIATKAEMRTISDWVDELIQAARDLRAHLFAQIASLSKPQTQ